MRHLVAAVAAVLVLGACSDDPTPRFEADPSDTPSLTPTPDEPEPWEEKSDEGAIAFVEHWVDTFNKSTVTGDSSALDDISSPSCVTCTNFIALTDDIYSAGGRVISDGWSIDSTSDPKVSGKSTLISIDITQSPQVITRAAGEQAERYPGGDVDYLATIRWSGEWQMWAMDVVQ